jgi:hypothetical protein
MTEIGKIESYRTPGDRPTPKAPLPPSGVVEIEYAPDKLAGAAAGSVLLIAASLFVALSVRQDVVTKFFGYFGTVFFGVAALKILWLLLSSAGPVVTFAPEGIRDTRFSAKFIPWNGIARISAWRFRSTKAIVFILKPGVREQVALTWYARLMRIPNLVFGIDGLAIAATGLKTDYQTLVQTTLAYARAYNPDIALTA